MATSNKVNWAQLKVGILAIVAMFFIALLVFLLSGNTSFFTSEVPLYTYVSDAASVNGGAPVRINGIDAGKVNSVKLSGLKDPRKTIRIDFAVQQPMLKEIPEDSQVSIVADNLLGSTKFLNIKRGQSQEAIKPNSEIPALDTREFDDVVQQGYTVLASLQGILTKADGIISQIEVGKGTIGKLLVDETLYKNLSAIVDQVQILANTLNSKNGTLGMIINSKELYDQAETTIAKLNTITDDLNAGKGTAGKILKDPALYDDLHKSINTLQAILDDLNAGKGTAGMLLKDPALAKQLSATLSKIDTTIDKVNSGQGTIGQLLVNPQLYDSVNGMTGELHGLLKDFRANPKKFLRIKVSIF
jgi:phospholipid/cholesterol/gamma-HCH transport system substrate-binding protein